LKDIPIFLRLSLFPLHTFFFLVSFSLLFNFYKRKKMSSLAAEAVQISDVKPG
jgi:hypothetical protein